MISESKLAILEKVGSADVQELVAEVRRLRSTPNRRQPDKRVHDAIMSLPYDMLYLHGGRRIVVDDSVLERVILKAIDGDGDDR